MSEEKEQITGDIQGSLQLKCQQCGGSFDFSENEQRFFAEMGFVTPRYCPSCRKNRKKDTLLKKGEDWKEYYDVVCEKCGKETTVPFKPVNGRPVYCRDCLGVMKGQNGFSTSLNNTFFTPPAELNTRWMGYSPLEDAERPYDELDRIVSDFLDEFYPPGKE